MSNEVTSTHESLAKYVTEKSGVEVSPEQAGALLRLHGKWQASPERQAERDAEKLEREARKQAAASAKAERARIAAEKAAAAAKVEDTEVAQPKRTRRTKKADDLIDA